MSNKVPEDELRRIASEYRHIQGEHGREGKSGSWRRRQKAQLSDLETRLQHILDHWFRDETTRAQWREHFFRAAPEPAPVHDVPHLYRGRSENGSVVDVSETQSGEWEYIVDDAVAERRKAGKSTEATVRLGGQTFQEAFDAPAEALRSSCRSSRPRTAPTPTPKAAHPTVAQQRMCATPLTYRARPAIHSELDGQRD